MYHSVVMKVVLCGLWISLPNVVLLLPRAAASARPPAELPGAPFARPPPRGVSGVELLAVGGGGTIATTG